MDVYQPNYKFIDDIQISEIVFDGESSDVTLFGYVANDDKTKYSRGDFICDFAMLTDVLLHLGETADPIIERITEILSYDFVESPTVVDLENILGRELTIRDLVLKVYVPKSEDENGEWVENLDDKCYFIDSITSKSDFLEKQKNEKQFAEYQDMLSDHFILLDNALNYYKQLTARGFAEKEARKRSGLSDELLFRIAFLNNKIFNHGK